MRLYSNVQTQLDHCRPVPHFWIAVILLSWFGRIIQRGTADAERRSTWRRLEPAVIFTLGGVWQEKARSINLTASARLAYRSRTTWKSATRLKSKNCLL